MVSIDIILNTKIKKIARVTILLLYFSVSLVVLYRVKYYVVDHPYDYLWSEILYPIILTVIGGWVACILLRVLIVWSLVKLLPNAINKEASSQEVIAIIEYDTKEQKPILMLKSLEYTQLLFIVCGLAILVGLSCGVYFQQVKYYNAYEYTNIGLTEDAFNQLNENRKKKYFSEMTFHLTASFVGGLSVLGVGLILIGFKPINRKSLD